MRDTGRGFTRRTFIRGTGLTAIGLGGAALLGCGGDDEDGDTSPIAGTATATPTGSAEATSTAGAAGPVSGGTYRTRITNDPASLDPYATASFTTKEFPGTSIAGSSRSTPSRTPTPTTRGCCRIWRSPPRARTASTGWYA